MPLKPEWLHMTRLQLRAEHSIALAGPVRLALSAKGGWSAWRRITFISAILIYGAASLAAWKLGLIGFHAA